MVKTKDRKINRSKYLFLENSEFSHGGLIEIETGKRKKMIRNLRRQISANKFPEEIKKSLLDISIVLHIRKGKYRRQDLDNLAKIILDSLEKPKIDDGFPYLYKNDNQIIRLLLYKLERVKDPDFETSQLSISARRHNPTKQMKIDLKEFLI